MKFTEEKLEKAFIELLGNESYPHHLGNSIARAADEVLIEADLLQYLLSKSLLSELLVKASHLCNFTQDTQIVSLKTR